MTPSPGKYPHEESTVVDLKAVPHDGWVFLSWEGDVLNKGNPETKITIKGDAFVKATFQAVPKAQHTLIITMKKEGDVGESTISPEPGTYTYEEGTLVIVEALPSIGSSFSHWEGDLEGVTPKQEFRIESNMEVRGVFSFFHGGIGGVGDPYEIKTPGQLFNVRNHISGTEKTYFRLVADIDLGGYHSGDGWKPIGLKDDGDLIPFNGLLNGNGYAITNLFIHRPHSSGVGFFAHIGEDGILDSIILNQVQEITGSTRTGALAGINEGEIRNSYASGIVESIGGRTGNLVGENLGTISRSYTDGQVRGGYDSGGLVGINFGLIEDSFALSRVTGTGSGTGGLVGRNEDRIFSSYAAGKVEGEIRTVGGLVGSNRDGVIERSYYDKEITNQSDTGKGEGRSTVEMRMKETFSNWDFVNTWSIIEEVTYPYQKWMD